MSFWGIENIAFEILGYPVSYVELTGTLIGLISVFLASRANILTWPTGIINEVFLFILFFQVQLYADMFLQVYFLITTLYGWYQWNRKPSEKDITQLGRSQVRLVLFVLFGGTLISGFLFANIHLYLPSLFKIQAAYPFIDSFIMISSIIATVLLANKKIENWYLWICADAVAVIIYYKKEVYFLSLEYLVFLGLASYGLYHWRKKIAHG